MRLLFVVFLGLFLPAKVLASPAQILLIVGDSLSAGYGVDFEQTWVARLQDKIKQAGFNVQVENASVSGDTSAGGLIRLQQRLEQPPLPTWVMIELGGNDGIRGLPLTQMKSNLSAMIERVKQAGANPILVDMKIPPNYGRKYTERFSDTYDLLASEQNIPLMPFLLENVALESELMQGDRIHPNDAAQEVIATEVMAFLAPLLAREKNNRSVTEPE